MYLKSLELSGFKSFAKKGELFFNSSISAIVGPNGSGKSNVAEAFRFVLGEQSIKSLRGKKGEDLIFNGSTDTTRANRASAKIVFDNSKRFLNVDFDEVVIERVVYRDGINEYYINGTQVRLKDIFELLAAANIGSSGHHIISQGEADRILNSSIKERKAMIEDGLGLKIYQYKRQESERKLEKTEENIKSVESLRREIQPHLKFLKKQVEKVEKALELKKNLTELYKEYLKRESEYIKHEKETLSKEKKPLEHELDTLEKDLAKAKDLLKKSETADEKSDHIIELEKKISNTRHEKDELVRELGRIEGRIAAEEHLLKKQNDLSKNTSGTVPFAPLKALAGEISQKISTAESWTDLQKIKSLLFDVKNLISSFVSSHENKNDDASLENIKNELEKLQNDKSKLDKKMKDLLEREKDLTSQYNDLRKEIEKEKDTSRDAERKMFEIMTKQNDLTSQLNLLNARQEKLNLEEEGFKRELGEAGVLVGREATLFEEFQVNKEEIISEPRSKQEERRRVLEKNKIRLEDSGAGSSDEIMKEFNEVSERDAFLGKELEDLDRSALTLKNLITELQEKIDTEFKDGITKINKQFQEFFSLMFGGGSASLEIVKEQKRKRKDTEISDVEEAEETITEEEEPEEGVDISVNLPRKKIKGLMMLSGGERALTSIALIFAMSQVKPPPFIVLDETDAALDEANSKKYGDMIENLAKHSQLILITHNRETMSRAGILYGVTMTGGVSKLLSIQFDEAVAVAK